MNITIKIDDKRIRELISEAGSRYWARDLVFAGNSLAFTLIEHGGVCNPGDDGETHHTVTVAMVRAGLTKLAHADHAEGGHHFAAVRDWKQSDMYTGDAIIQFSIFGEMKYG